MKKITFLVFGLLLNCLASFAQTTIGSQSNLSQPIPFEPYYGYSYSQSIYLASQINTPSGEITELQWDFGGVSALTNSQELVIYMANTTKSNYTDGNDWISSENLTQVYSGGITVNGSGWVTITLDTAFEYNGTDNLVIAVEENMAGYDANENFYASSVATNQTIYYYSDGNNPEPNSPPQGSIITYIPNVVLEGITPTCPPPSNLGVSSSTTDSATLTWQENGEATTYTVAYGSPGFTIEEGETTTANSTTFELENLAASTSYEYYVQADCSEDDLSTWVGPFEFVTACGSIDQFTQDFETATPYETPYCWTSVNQNTDQYSYMQTTNYGASTGTNAFTMFNNTSGANATMMLVSPEVTNLASGTQWLTINAKGSNENDFIQIGTLSDPNDASTFNSLYSENISSEYQLYTFDLTAYEGTDTYIAIKRSTTNDYSSIYLDNIIYEAMPSCVFPYNVSLDEITNSSAILSWQGTADSYEYVLDITAADPSTTASTVTTNTVSIEDLDDYTSYYLHVRSVCDEETYSEWTTYNFTTSIINDTCAYATSITASTYPDCDSPVAGTTVGATHTENSTCGSNYNDVWFSFTPETSGNYYFESDNASTSVVVWTGACSNLTELNSNCNYMVSATLTAGTTYYISVLSYNTNPQSFNLCAQLLPAIPANDSCATATELDEFPFTNTMDAAGATNNDGFINVCTSSYGVNDGVWYTFTPVTSGDVTLELTEVGSWQPEIGVYSGSCGDFTCEGYSSVYNDGYDVSLTVTVTAGTQYFVNVGYNSGYTDYLEKEFTITIDSEDAALATTSFTKAANVNYYPNPVNQNKLTLNAAQTINHITVYNVLGQNVLNATPNTTNYTLDMSSLAAGTYMLQLSINGTTETIKVLKQ